MLGLPTVIGIRPDGSAAADNSIQISNTMTAPITTDPMMPDG